jgi:4-amino-4-deoxy-L-arabinose transferase-like glycosyltransferase
VLALAALTRLYQWQAPLVDQMYVKQVFVANKARSIASPPLNPLRSALDFLDPDGRRMELTEEVPLYTGLLGASYRLLGEREWLGRAWSLLATLAAIVALDDLLRREFDETTARVGSFLFAVAPLLIFYGRAVLPDPAMLAFMLMAAAAYRRHLDGGGRRWLVAATVCGLLAGLCKYYGLMVLIPLAEMAWRAGGRRALISPANWLAAAVMVVPVGLWTAGVFFRTVNPAMRTTYFAFQQPGVLLLPRLYERLTLGFLVRDCGPVLAPLVALGAWAAWRGRARVRPLVSWTVMGLLFFFLLAPKLLDHDYYELMMLPAAAGWGAIGWGVLRSSGGGAARRGPILAAAVLGLAAVVHSPLVSRAKFEHESGHVVLARRLDALCSRPGRVVVMGQRYGWPIVHYSRREGWVDQSGRLPADWQARLADLRARGAELVAVYLDPTVGPRARASFAPLFAALPVVERRSGPWFRRARPCDYVILSLRDDAADARAEGRRPLR